MGDPFAQKQVEEPLQHRGMTYTPASHPYTTSASSSYGASVSQASTQPRLTPAPQPPQAFQASPQPVPAVEKPPPKPEPSSTWNVYPPSLTIQANDNSNHQLFVVNFSSNQQMVEVQVSKHFLCSLERKIYHISSILAEPMPLHYPQNVCKWLCVSPPDLVLPPLTTSQLSVSVVPSQLPRTGHPATHALQVRAGSWGYGVFQV